MREFIGDNQMTATLPLQGLNFLFSLLLPATVLLSTLLLDDHSIKLLAILIGAIAGGVGVDYLRPEPTLKKNLTKIACSSVLALPLSFTVVRYFELDSWEYHLSIGASSGLLSIVFWNVVLIVADEQLKPSLTKTIKWFFSRFDKDK